MLILSREGLGNMARYWFATRKKGPDALGGASCDPKEAPRTILRKAPWSEPRMALMRKQGPFSGVAPERTRNSLTDKGFCNSN